MNNFFNFDKYINELQKRVADAIREGQEFEIRFGEFKVHRDQSGAIERDSRGKVKRSFDSTFETESFYTLKKMLDNQTSVEKTIINTKEYIYKMDSGFSARKIVELSESTESFMKKMRVSNYDIYDYNIRLSSSREINITKEEF